MNQDKQLKQIIEKLCKNFDGTALVSFNKDGSLNIETEPKSEYSFVVYDENSEFTGLLDKLKEIGYSIDLETFRGLIPGREVIKVDVAKKAVTRPMIVGVNHYIYLRRTESILLKDAIDNFEEIVVKQNKELADSLRQKKNQWKDKDKKNENK